MTTLTLFLAAAAYALFAAFYATLAYLEMACGDLRQRNRALVCVGVAAVGFLDCVWEAVK